MIDLSNICGLPIKLDETSGTLTYDDAINYDEEVMVPISSILPILLNKFLKYPEQVYTKHVGMCHCDHDYNKDVLSYDLYKIPQGLLGIEFIKTHVYYSDSEPSKYACFVEVLKGKLTVVIQRNQANTDPYSFTVIVDEIEIFHLEEGDRIAIPTGVYFTFVNAGAEAAVFTIISCNLKEADLQFLQREKGLAIYIISKNSKLEIVTNPRYKVRQIPAQKIWNELEVDRRQKYSSEYLLQDKPLYDILKLQTEQLMQVLV